MVRHYSSTAGPMALQAGISSGATTLTLDTVTGLPAVPFTLILDYGTASEEVVTCTALVGTTATVTRGDDGTAAVSHLAGAVVRHGASARDLADAQTHIAASSGVHGLTGAVLGTTDSQTVEGKTFAAASGSNTPLKVQAASGQSAAIQDWRDSSGTAQSSVDSKGRFSLAGLLITKPVNALVSLIVRAAVGQAEALIEAHDSSDVMKFRVGTDGAVTTTAGVTASGAVSGASVAATGAVTGASVAATGAVTAASEVLTSTATGTVTETVKRVASQSADLTEWVDESNNVLAKVTKDGNGIFANLPTKLISSSGVYSTNSSGNATINTGLTTLSQITMLNGDSSTGSLRFARVGSISGGTITVHVWNGDGTDRNSSSARIDWIATGS